MLISVCSFAQPTVIAYFSGNATQVDEIPTDKLTHIIYSFCHLKGNELAVDSDADAETIRKLVTLKTKNPNLKVMLSLGGWGGCETCSDVFSNVEGIRDFVKSVKRLCDQYNTDGIDLDWEYPAIEGYPGHKFKPEDKENFTRLVQSLRKELGTNREISFAAGGFKSFIDQSIDWQMVMPLIDRVNLMSYDLVNGYSTLTGHHTALYSTSKQSESTDFGVKELLKSGVPANKLVIGAAFYARVWEDVPSENNGLYQSGKFKTSVRFRDFPGTLDEGFVAYWDDEAKAPYLYNADEKVFATYDSKESVRLKTQYVLDNGLQGIMFWEMTLDQPVDGLLSEIAKTISERKK